MQAECLGCHRTRRGLESSCPDCGGIYDLKPDFNYRDKTLSNFPYVSKLIELGEVETPILNSDSFMAKLDYFHPTYSYKDRGSRILLSYLLEKAGASVTVNEDSSGNAGASIAAYSAAAGIRARIFVSRNSIKSKLEQIRAYGADVVEIDGTREEVSSAAKKAPGVYLGHSYWPEFRDGIRTLAYEIFRQCHYSMPDSIYVPLSAGTLFLGLVRGLEHLVSSGEIESVPKIITVQPELNSPICSELDGVGRNYGHSIADALVTRNSPLKDPIIDGIRKYGLCISVTEDEIIGARNSLSLKGVLAEYSSATVYAALRKKRIGNNPMIVLTGNGLKTL